jgi:uncharacterized protein
MSIHAIVLEMKKLLRSLDSCLEKSVAYAATRKFDPSVLLQSRIAPDMFPLMRQIQATCDQAKYAAGRTANKEIPSHADTEQTMDEARQRIATVITYLDGFGPSDFQGADERTISLPRWEGKSMTAAAYFVEHAMPNFFFHLTTSYAILRHNGVDVGKRDYLGPLPYRT